MLYDMHMMWVILSMSMIKGLEGYQCNIGSGSGTRRGESLNGLPGMALAMAQGSSIMDIKLEPEPEGGKELTPLKTLPNCRMKEMKGFGDGYQFWMTAQAEGKLVQEIRTQILKDASKKANFPGFRKGQIPPYAQPQITQFAVQESLIKTVQGAIEAFGLEALPGSDGKMEVYEDVQQISNDYAIGDSIPFTAAVNCKYSASAVQQQKGNEAIDVVSNDST